jgi:hypothetical protein
VCCCCSGGKQLSLHFQQHIRGVEVANETHDKSDVDGCQSAENGAQAGKRTKCLTASQTQCKEHVCLFIVQFAIQMRIQSQTPLQ